MPRVKLKICRQLLGTVVAIATIGGPASSMGMPLHTAKSRSHLNVTESNMVRVSHDATLTMRPPQRPEDLERGSSPADMELPWRAWHSTQIYDNEGVQHRPSYAEHVLRRKERSTRVQPESGQSVMLIRIMSCCVLLLLTGLTLIVFLTSSTGYPDVVAQVCCEISIMAAYTCVLLTTTDEPQLSEKQCLVTSVCLQYFFLSVFLFLLIESAYVCRLLSPALVPVPFNSISVGIAGFGFPAIVTGASAGTLGHKYTRQGQICWLDLSEGASYTTTVPVCACVLLQLVFLGAAFCCTRPRRNLSSGLFQRARTQLSTRWASLLVLVSTVLSWSSGVAAEHQRSRGLYVCFSVSTIMLGVFIITLRITTEDQVRRRLLIKVGLSNAVADASSPTCSSVLSWSRESLSSSRNSYPDSSQNNTVSTTSTPEVHRLKVFNPTFK